MAMGNRPRHAKQASMWVLTSDLPRSIAASAATQEQDGLNPSQTQEYLEGVERQAEERGVLQREVMVIRNAAGAGLREEPVGKGIAEGEDTTTRPGSRFENRHLVTGLSELVRRRQAGESRSDDDDLLGTRRAL